MSNANSVVSAFLVAFAKATSKLEEFMRTTLKKAFAEQTKFARFV